MKLKYSTSNMSSKDLLIKFQGRILNNVVSLDEHTVEYFNPNATINDTGYYPCYVMIPFENAKRFVCSTYITVGYKPLPVEAFSCISQEYRKLICSWKAPPNPVKTDYILYDYFYHENVRRLCPEYLNATSCLWAMDTRAPYMRSRPQLTFMMVGRNSLGTNKQYFNVEHFKIVKPSAPLSANCSRITPTTVFLEWSSPANMEYGEFRPGLMYSIQYRPLSSDSGTFKELWLYFQTAGSVEIGDLIPYTEYEFKIRSRSNVSESDLMWSPYLTISAKTLPDSNAA
ncbi:cytokine receptor-like [Stegodyphus dumicola]|uniref:cytokine receptor-like n=1 Tax=Stegodyphus dumicola TaxID=202533 RepID=UPI0015B2BC7D|nr:cytokine receptor-like [Stegodyphus dumicola]